MALALLIASVVAQVIAVIQALRLAWRQGRPGWIMLVVGMVFMLGRRLVRFAYEWTQGREFDSVQEFLGLVISVAFAIGLSWLIHWPQEPMVPASNGGDSLLKPLRQLKRHALFWCLLALLCMMWLVKSAYDANQQNFPLLLGLASILIVVVPLSLGLLYQLGQRAQQTAVEAVLRQQEGERSFRLLMETTQDLIWTVDLEGKFTFVSPSVEPLLGYAPAELIGRPFSDLQDAERRAIDRARMAETFKTGSVRNYETYMLRKDGAKVWLNANAVLLRDEAGKVIGVTGTSQDISVRREAELALRASEERLRRLVDSNLQGIIFTDIHGRITQTNDAFLTMVGYTREDFNQGLVNWNKMTPPEFADLDRKAIEELAATGFATPWEKEYIRKDGNRVSVYVGVAALAGNRQEGVAFVVDISRRKGAERALRENEETFRRMIEFAPEAVVLLDMTTGHFIRANPAAERMFGMTAAALNEVGPLDLSPEFQSDGRTSTEVARELLGRALVTQIPAFEWLHRDASGRDFPCEIRLLHLKLGGMDVIRGSMIDISERKQAVQALRLSEERNRQLFEQASDGIFLTDHSGHFIDVNASGLRMFGYTREEMLSLTIPDCHFSEDMPRLTANMPDLLSGKTLHEEFRFKRKDGSGFHGDIISCRLSNELLLGILRDISGSKAAEQALRDNLGKLAGILRAAPVGIGVAIDRCFTEVNDTACAILGYTRAEILGRHLRFIYPNDEEFARVGHEYVQLQHQPKGTVETRCRRKDGTIIDVIFTAVAIDPARLSSGVIFTLQDITESRHAAEVGQLQSAALAAAGNAISITDHEGTLQWVNPAFEAMSGYAAAEATGRKPNLLNSGTHPKEFFRDLWATVTAGRVWRGQITNRTKHGKIYITEQTIAPVMNAAGQITHFISVQQEITYRRRAEEALQQSREEFIDLFDNAPIGYHEVNAEGLLTRINQTELNMLGYNADELTGQPVWKIAADEQSSQEAVTNKLRGSRSAAHTFERSFRRKDGSIFPVLIEDRILRNEAGVIVGIRSVVQDMTARKQAENKARHLANFPELNPNPVLEFNALGDLVYHNPAALNMAQLVGHPDLSSLLPAQTRKILTECLATGQPHLRLETQHNLHTLSWSFYPITTHQVVHCYVGDISKRLQLEEQFRQAQKMEAIGQLSGGVAHDFNNLLTVILGNLGLLQSSGQVTRDQVEPLQAIAHAANRAANLTRQLLAFSRQQVMQQQHLDLNAVVGNISKMLRRVIGEAVQIRLDYAMQTLPIHADPGMLEQVILNLCINARDAMPAGGLLNLRTTAVTLSDAEARLIPAARAGKFATLSVIDNGTGITPDNLKRVFEPFFTTKEVGKGTGLGLASVYGIAQQHNGWVTVQSELGQGTNFTIYLPLLATQPVAPTIPASAGKLPLGHETILLVEDDLAVQAVARIALTRLGYQVLVASNGRQALNLWQEKRDQIHLVLTDMIMPEGLSGKDIARRFKADRPDIRIIFMSGYNADIAGTDFTQSDGDAFIGKPFEIYALATLLRRSLDLRN